MADDDFLQAVAAAAAAAPQTIHVGAPGDILADAPGVTAATLSDVFADAPEADVFADAPHAADVAQVAAASRDVANDVARAVTAHQADGNPNPFPFIAPAAGAVQVGGGVVYVPPLNLDQPDGGRSFLAAVSGFFGGIVKGLYDIVRLIIWVIKYPVILLFVCYLTLVATGFVFDTATDTLAPVCSFFPALCRSSAAPNRFSNMLGKLRKAPLDLGRIDFPGLMDLQSRTLDQLLSHSAAGTQLALGVKHAELAVKDLGIIVKTSNLTSKDVIARNLEEFAQDAKVTGRDLQQLSAKLYGAVDTCVFTPFPTSKTNTLIYLLRSILAFDEYALRSIGKAQASGKNATDTATQLFRSSMTVLSAEVARVIIDATSTAARLDTLEEKLYIIRSLCEQEMLLTQTAVGEVLSELWTALGGNRAKLQHLEQQVDVLRNVDWYRALSVSHVASTTATLEAIEAELSELRDKLASPALAGDTIPLEVHIASIERGARRIQERKLQTRGDIIHDGVQPRWGQKRLTGVPRA